MPNDNRPKWGRTLGFQSGPQNVEFFACDEHKEYLEKGDVTCFFKIPKYPMRELDEDEQDTYECHFCQEG